MFNDTLLHSNLASSKCNGCRSIFPYVIGCTSSVVSLVGERLFATRIWCLPRCNELVYTFLRFLYCGDIKTSCCLLSERCESISTTV